MATASSLIPASSSGHNVPALREAAPTSLLALAELYFRTQALGQAEGTIEAKRRDLERFLSFYLELYGRDDPAEWYTSVTREFLKGLRRNRSLSPATVHRVYSSVRHFARWAYKNADAFPHGCPTDGVKPPEEPEGNWTGLTRANELRLLNAARTLQMRPGRGVNQGLRDHALITALLGSALRISELLGLDVDQYDGRGFRDVLAKGGTRRKFVPLERDARLVLEEWLAQRGLGPGPLFTTSRGKRLGRKQAYEVLKRAEKQANAHLTERERFTVTPHVLRHTLLRKIAEQKGIQYAKKLSGHRSDKYIWRYVQPSEQALEEALDDLE